MGFKAVHFTRIDREDVEDPEFKKVQVTRLITRDDGAENFVMRCFEIAPGDSQYTTPTTGNMKPSS